MKNSFVYLDVNNVAFLMFLFRTTQAFQLNARRFPWKHDSRCNIQVRDSLTLFTNQQNEIRFCFGSKFFSDAY